MPLKKVVGVYDLANGGSNNAQTKTQQFSIHPAPTKGLNASFPLIAQDPLTGVLIDNWWTRRYGIELRSGSARWTTNLGGASTPSSVLSLMTYLPPVGTTGIPKLFAACANGNIYDVSTQTNEAAVPAVMQIIPGQINAGVFSWTNFATASTNYLCICAAGAGYWTYDSVGGWVNRTAAISGAGSLLAVNFDFVMAWKNRLWFIVNGTSDAIFLGTNAISGASSIFDFGPLLTHGGGLQAMATWTVDGGDGLDDKLVLVASGGDVLVYQGTDPATATTFGIHGKWYVGRPPIGRRFLSKYGGDLAILCEVGVEFMSNVLQAFGLRDPMSAVDEPAKKFNELIGNDVRLTQSSRFWQMIFLPSETSSIVITPHNKTNDAKQYVFASMAKAWTTFSNLNMVCGEVFEGSLYYGTDSGTVIKAFIGETDDYLTDGTPGKQIEGLVQTAFVAPSDDRVSVKRPLLALPMFQASHPPAIQLQINTEWQTQSTPGAPAFNPSGSSLWDTGKWDESIWFGESNSYQTWSGVQGLGVFASLRMSVAVSYTHLTLPTKRIV